MNYLEHVKKVQEQLETYGCKVLIIEELIDIYYLTGLNLSAGKFFVYREGACLFVDGRYFEICQKSCSFPVKLLNNNCFEEWFKSDISSVSNVGFDSASTTYKSYLEWQNILKKVSESTPSLSSLKLVPIDQPLKPLRQIKDSQEIELLRQAAQLGSKGYDYLCTLLKEGVTELELAIELEIFWKRNGSKALAFDPIIAFGANSSMPHHRAGNTKLNQGDVVLFDIGVNLAHYHSDMTRVVFFGTPPKQIVEIYNVVLEAQQRALDLCKPGTLIKDIDDAARSFIASKGFGKHFPHGLGHGVGLNIHEPPTLNEKTPDRSLPLAEGMVITIEPGVYLSGIGGVRIEDTIVITSEGHENLTNRSKEISIIIERDGSVGY